MVSSCISQIYTHILKSNGSAYYCITDDDRKTYEFRFEEWQGYQRTVSSLFVDMYIYKGIMEGTVTRNTGYGKGCEIPFMPDYTPISAVSYKLIK